MKRIVFIIVFACLTTLIAQSQPKLTGFGVYEDFSTDTDTIFNTATGRGLYWWPTKGTHIIARDTTNNLLLVKMTQKAYGYVPFGLSFGDSNGAAAGGSPFTVDLSVDGTFSFDIINKDTAQDISMRVACHDTMSRQIDCDGGALTFNDIWKYQTQIIIPRGDTVTFKAGTPNGAGGNIINSCNFATGVWGDYGTTPHIIRTDCDLKHIKQITFTVLNAKKKATDGHAEALDTCLFAIANVKIGDTTVNAKTAPIPDLLLSTRTAAMPDTAKAVVKIDFTSTGNWSAKSNMTWLNVKIDTVTRLLTLTALTSNTTTAVRTAIVTVSAKYAASHTVVVTQAVAKDVSIANRTIENKSFHVIGNTIYFDNKETQVFTIIGKLYAEKGQSSVVLPAGIYIVNSPSVSAKIVIAN